MVLNVGVMVVWVGNAWLYGKIVWGRVGVVVRFSGQAGFENLRWHVDGSGWLGLGAIRRAGLVW